MYVESSLLSYTTGKLITQFHAGNERLQEMMKQMVEQRGGRVCAMDDRYMPPPISLDGLLSPKINLRAFRYCIDNGCMIAWTGMLMLNSGITTEMKNTWCTQRYAEFTSIPSHSKLNPSHNPHLWFFF